MGNETFAHWRQLPGSLWAGVCDYDQFWSLAGRVAQSAEAMPNFSFCYVTSRKNQLFCAPILYTVVPVMNGHPRDQAKVSVHCRWPLVTGTDGRAGDAKYNTPCNTT